MSAYANPQNQSQAASGLGQLEGLAGTLRALESALHQEKEKSRKLAADLAAQSTAQEQALQELRTRNRELELNQEKYKAAVSLHLENENKISQQYKGLNAEYLRLRDELNQYRAAWAEVLQREKEAKLIIAEGDKARERIRDLERQLDSALGEQAESRKRIEQLERHSKSYQEELQAALIRLHSAESKFSELSKEYETFRASKRNMDEELAKIEATMSERMQWVALKEREKIRTELEKEAAQDREKSREAFHEIRISLEAQLARLTQSVMAEERRSQQLSSVLITEKVRHQDELSLLQEEVLGMRKILIEAVDSEVDLELVLEQLDQQQQRIAAARAKATVMAQPDASI
jgi:chromosome segregation ATPase